MKSRKLLFYSIILFSVFYMAYLFWSHEGLKNSGDIYLGLVSLIGFSFGLMAVSYAYFNYERKRMISRGQIDLKEISGVDFGAIVISIFSGIVILTALLLSFHNKYISISLGLLAVIILYYAIKSPGRIKTDLS